MLSAPSYESMVSDGTSKLYIPGAIGDWDRFTVDFVYGLAGGGDDSNREGKGGLSVDLSSGQTTKRVQAGNGTYYTVTITPVFDTAFKVELTGTGHKGLTRVIGYR